LLRFLRFFLRYTYDANTSVKGGCGVSVSLSFQCSLPLSPGILRTKLTIYPRGAEAEAAG
jgi:hypothetical protein